MGDTGVYRRLRLLLKSSPTEVLKSDYIFEREVLE